MRMAIHPTKLSMDIGPGYQARISDGAHVDIRWNSVCISLFVALDSVSPVHRFS